MYDQRSLIPGSPLFKPKQAAVVERKMREKEQSRVTAELFEEHPYYAGRVAITEGDPAVSPLGEDFDELAASVAALDKAREVAGYPRGGDRPTTEGINAASARRAGAALVARNLRH